jgi:hypothetical protein
MCIYYIKVCIYVLRMRLTAVISFIQKYEENILWKLYYFVLKILRKLNYLPKRIGQKLHY